MESLAINKHQSWAKVPSVIRRLRARKEMNFWNFSTFFAFSWAALFWAEAKTFFPFELFIIFLLYDAHSVNFLFVLFKSQQKNLTSCKFTAENYARILNELEKVAEKNCVIPFPLSGEGSRHETNMKNALCWNRIHVPHFTWLIKRRALRCRCRFCRRNVSEFFAFFMNL